MGKALMFMLFVWMVVNMAGGIMTGQTTGISTRLTAGITAEEKDTIPVARTVGFLESGTITIGDERIGYPAKSANSFDKTLAQDINRGYDGTDSVVHLKGESVRVITNSVMNDSLQYQIATLTDASGFLGFLSIPFKFLKLLFTFFTLPVTFLGTDLEILGWLWAVLSIGILTVIAVAVVGGRRV